jgi:uncharacterized protein
MKGKLNTMQEQKPPASFEDAVTRIAKALKPSQIILFGSRARGDHRVDSDYDILVITETGETGEPHELARIASRVLRGRSFALDLLALPKAHIAARMEHSTLLKKIFKEGKVIYAA